MRRSTNFLLFFALSTLILLNASCGGMMSNSMQNRMMQSITVTPSSADAQMFPSGQVQFMATGNFNMPPMMQTVPVQWSLASMVMGQAVPTGVSIDPASGMAQCSGFMGAVQVKANFTMNPDMAATAAQVIGTAQLTCP
jgi:hypothetical protein